MGDPEGAHLLSLTHCQSAPFSPQFQSSNMGSAMLPFPVVPDSHVRVLILSVTLWGAPPPALP